MQKAVYSLQKGLEILCCFGLDRPTLSAQAISKELNIPLSTTYRYVQSLEEKQFLIKSPGTKKYGLGFMLFQLGNIAASQTKLVQVVMPHMETLASLSGETVFLTVLSGRRTVCLERIEAQKAIRMSLERGSSLPLHAGASSKILLAYQENSFVESMVREVGLERFTPNTITDLERLKEELEAIRRRGFAFSDQEVDLGAKAISAPILDQKGRIIAGLSVAGPSERINERSMQQLCELVKGYAQRISHDLGYSRTPLTSPGSPHQLR